MPLIGAGRPAGEAAGNVSGEMRIDPKPRIAIVAHGGTNSVALTHLLDIQPVPWEWIRFESELAAFSVLQARQVGPEGFVWSLQNFNEIDPLKAEGLR